MALVKTPVKGMNDFLPRDMAMRLSIMRTIRETYGRFGFQEIGTPALEHIENLTGKMGGENEKLIFPVMKRGAALARAREAGENLADSGLRYDLTLPLSRFYALHGAELPVPFKALQIGPVWRADQPQKGRFRQFVQCDIDILGDASNLAEVELLCATGACLTTLFETAKLSRFTVHLNDRRILRAVALQAGFPEDRLDSALIALDKFDKIGREGVEKELCDAGFDPDSTARCLTLFDRKDIGSAVDFCRGIGEEFLAPEAAKNLDEIRLLAAECAGENVRFVFDPTLVRGMGYYTGPIFEVTLDGYNFAVAGGGRYDEMIGRFSGQKVPACGFSIGFERIVTVLLDHGAAGSLAEKGGTAFLVDARVDADKKKKVFALAAEKRKAGSRATVLPLKKNARFQIDRLMEDGFGEIVKVYPDTEL